MHGIKLTMEQVDRMTTAAEGVLGLPPGSVKVSSLEVLSNDRDALVSLVEHRASEVVRERFGLSVSDALERQRRRPRGLPDAELKRRYDDVSRRLKEATRAP